MCLVSQGLCPPRLAGRAGPWAHRGLERPHLDGGGRRGERAAQQGPEEENDWLEMIYFPYRGALGWPATDVIVQSPLDGARLLPALREALSGIGERGLHVARLASLESRLDQLLGPQHQLSLILGISVWPRSAWPRAECTPSSTTMPGAGQWRRASARPWGPVPTRWSTPSSVARFHGAWQVSRWECWGSR